MSHAHNRELPYRPKTTPPETQSWAEWWSANVDSDSQLAYRNDLQGLVTDVGPLQHPSAQARILKLARRHAWQTRPAPPAPQLYQDWSAQITSTPNLITAYRLARANVVENLSDAMAQQTGSQRPAPLAAAETQLETPSIEKLVACQEECVDAICEYLLKHASSPAPWTEENGLSMPPNTRFDPQGLERDNHRAFLRVLLGRLPAGFTGLDAARPWMFYWTSNALRLMGFDFEQTAALVETLTPIQDQRGGFGGGQGQDAHLATTYASTLALVCTGQPAQAMRLIDRRALYEWLGRLKQPDGAFTMAEGGEVDSRAVYIVLVLVSLLNLPRELPASAPARARGHTTFADGIGEYVRRCQSYEGGLGCNPGAEAHGAYTFCSLGALSLLDAGAGPASIRAWLDFDALLEWLQWRQDDITGGLAGRTNKLVDNCYSHWIGGCWPLVENALAGRPELFNRDALALYVLAAGQNADGGLRDKPSMAADGYHTCYGLAGLAMCTHRWTFAGGAWSHERYDAAAAAAEPLAAMHPVYAVPADCAQAALDYFHERPLVV